MTRRDRFVRGSPAYQEMVTITAWLLLAAILGAAGLSILAWRWWP